MATTTQAKASPTLYYDMTTPYLELHAMRAPLGPYAGDYAEENDPHGYNYDARIEDEVRAFSETHDVELYLLGRSGRHVCIADTPRNRRRYASLKRKAIEAAQAMWRDMKDAAARKDG